MTVAISKAFVVDLKLLPFAVGSRSVTAPERLGLYLLLDRGVLSPFGEIEWTLECDLDCVGIFTLTAQAATLDLFLGLTLTFDFLGGRATVGVVGTVDRSAEVGSRG